jgi:hypothetical protein
VGRSPGRSEQAREIGAVSPNRLDARGDAFPPRVEIERVDRAPESRLRA